jgi:Leucine-rich repeat (LRR) protein
MFYGLINIKKLRLWVAGINSFEIVKEALSVPGLQYLDIGGNEIRESPPENIFRGLQSTVTHLGLCQNNFIEPLPQLLYNLSEFAFLTELTSLDLSYNNIYSITIDRPLPNLVELELFGNKMGSFPQTYTTSNVSLLPSLKTLRIGSNGMQIFCPSHLDWSLPQLAHLDISHNTLYHTCPGVFSKFPLLQSLDLSYSDAGYESLRTGMFTSATLVNVSSLGMIHFYIKYAPAGLFTGCPNLQRVDMSDLDFRDVDVSKFMG